MSKVDWKKYKLRYLIELSSGNFLTAEELDETKDYPAYGGNGFIGKVDKFNVNDEVLIIGRVGAHCGNVHHINKKAWITDNALICKTVNNYRFMYYALASLELNSLANRSAQPVITGTKIKNQYIFYPNAIEQKKIADFLDISTKRIEKIIEIKEEQLKNLKELKRSIIQKAVTRGLKDNSELRDSGIDWIKEIPIHWKIERLKNILLINKFSLSSKIDESYKIKYLEISNVNVNGIISEEGIEELDFVNAPSRAKRKIKENDIVVSSVRPNLQAIAYIDLKEKNLVCSTGFFTNTVLYSSQIDSRFVYYCLLSESSKHYLIAHGKGVGYPAVDEKDYFNLKIPIPPLDEQNLIAKFLDKETTKLDTLYRNVQEQIKTLKEYKKSLIYEYVTGKKRVKE